MSIVLNNKQEQGLKEAVARYKAHEKWTCISGYAGTGKSTLVKFIIEALGLSKQDVAYIAYTGKAAQVLADKDCPNATTAHKLLYKSYRNNDGTFRHVPRQHLERPYKAIVVDEVSMLPKEMWEVLVRHNIYVIALGDPFQLPPVNATDNGILLKPHVFLEDIQRQARDSEIIRLTMDIRDRKPLNLLNGEQVKIIPKSNLIDGMFFWADQVIVGRNDTRRQYNQYLREQLHGVQDTKPVVGDKLICLRNYWDIMSMTDEPLVNGTIGTIDSIKYSRKNKIVNPIMTISFSAEGLGGVSWFPQIEADYKYLTTGEPTVTKENFKKIPQRLRPCEFDYGYVITCHKSQGSEYPKVLVLEEHLGGSDHARWLYTACTRAKEKLVIVKDYH